jgi:hypothetical protein
MKVFAFEKMEEKFSNEYIQALKDLGGNKE